MPLLLRKLNTDICSIILNYIPIELYSVLSLVCKQWCNFFSKKSKFNDAAKWCVRNSCISLLKWLKINQFEFTYDLTNEASFYGNIKMLKWLLNKKCPTTIEIASTKYVIVLEFLNSKGLIRCYSIDYCSTIETYNWFKSKKQNIANCGIKRIIEKQYNELFIKLLKDDIINYEDIDDVIRYGNLIMFKEMINNDINNIDEDTYDHIIFNERKDFLLFIYESNNFQWPSIIINCVFLSHNVKISKWLYKNNHPYCEKMFYLAIIEGDIEFINELFKNNPILKKDMWGYARNINTLEWLKENECPKNKEYRLFQPTKKVRQWFLKNKFTIEYY